MTAKHRLSILKGIPFQVQKNISIENQAVNQNREKNLWISLLLLLVSSISKTIYNGFFSFTAFQHPLFQFPTLHIIFSLLIQHPFNFNHFNGFFIQYPTPPPFISYSYLILYFCFYNYIKLQLSIIIKLK